MQSYSIDQVYLFYEKCKKNAMGQDKMNAIILANALMYTSPNADSKKAQSNWEKFLSSLTWDKLTDKTNKPSPISSLQKLGVPIIKK